MRLPLRIQLLLVTAAIFAALTATILFVVRQSVRGELRRQIAEATESSATDFVRLQQQQSAELERSATLLAELPILKSLMHAEDTPTIQDASTEFRDLSDTDLLLLARPDSEVVAIHVGGDGMSHASATKLVQASIHRRDEAGLWQEGNEIYLVVIRPIISGAGAESNTLGYLVLGKRINDSVAKDLGSYAGSDILLTAGDSVIAATQHFSASQLQAIYKSTGEQGEVRLGDRHYGVARVNLPANSPTPIYCYLLLPLTSWDAFLGRLNQMVLVLGAIAVFGAVALVLLISRAITGPLESLVGAVRALAEGNYKYSLHPSGSTEVVELGTAFNSMRHQLLDSQQKQLEAERLAALGRAAGSISHDLRHQLAAVVANAEFLYNVEELKFDREEIYLEVRRGAAQMTELIDSLVEISRDKPNLAPLPANIGRVVRKAADTVLASPELRHCRIEVLEHCPTDGVFDSRKLERAFFNLLLNACESRPDHNARVMVEISETEHGFECRVRDNGEGVPDSIHSSLFQPFVSAGKNNGTGLGLAIARKIVEDHGGEILLESTSPQGSVFLVRIPDEAPMSQNVPAIASRTTMT